MLSFVPEQLKKNVKREYWARVFCAVLLILCFLAIYSLSSIFPTYTFSVSEKARLTEEISGFSTSTSSCASGETICVDPASEVKSSILLLNSLKITSRTIISQPILEILGNVNKSIKITSIKYLGETTDQYKFSIVGISLDREGLTAFSDSLKKDARLSGISLPISDFVKNTNIDFNLTIMVKK